MRPSNLGPQSAFPRTELVTWSVTSTFDDIYTKRTAKLDSPRREMQPAALVKPGLQRHPYGLLFPPRSIRLWPNPPLGQWRNERDAMFCHTLPARTALCRAPHYTRVWWRGRVSAILSAAFTWTDIADFGKWPILRTIMIQFNRSINILNY